jgi:flagellar basal body-associated protein FliL
MVVEPRKTEGDKPTPSKRALIISIGAHLVVFFLVIFGLPHFRDETIISDPVPVELVSDIGQLTTTNKQPVEAPKPDKPKPEPPQKTEEQKKTSRTQKINA